MVLGIRRATVVLVTVAGFVLAACSPERPPAADAGAAATAPGGASNPDVSGATPMASGDPCALVTPADVRATFGQTVTAIARLDVETDADGATSQLCALATDGVPLSGPDVSAVSAVASGFTGGHLTDELATAAIGVRLMIKSQPVDVAAFETEKFPPGSKVLSGVGVFGVVLGLPGSGAVGYALASPTRGVLIYDLEDRRVPADQVEKLLRAAVSR
jgi:hypothetical protein